jgi:hypothetical protein
MSKVRADNFTNRAADGAPTFTKGVSVTGVITATSGSFSGNVSVGGTLTYEDVTNIDSVGVVTARLGIRVGAGQSIGSDGALTYYGDGSQLTGAGLNEQQVTLLGWLTVSG